MVEPAARFVVGQPAGAAPVQASPAALAAALEEPGALERAERVVQEPAVAARVAHVAAVVQASVDPDAVRALAREAQAASSLDRPVEPGPREVAVSVESSALSVVALHSRVAPVAHLHCRAAQENELQDHELQAASAHPAVLAVPPAAPLHFDHCLKALLDAWIQARAP